MNDENEPFTVFESTVDASFAFLITKFQFRRSPSRRTGRSIIIGFERSGLVVECVYEFGEAIELNFVYTPSSGTAAGCTIHEVMAVRCPEEKGWPYAKHLPGSWPKSSNLRSSEVIGSLVANYARVLSTQLNDVLESTSKTDELIRSFTRKG